VADHHSPSHWPSHPRHLCRLWSTAPSCRGEVYPRHAGCWFTCGCQVKVLPAGYEAPTSNWSQFSEPGRKALSVHRLSKQHTISKQQTRTSQDVFHKTVMKGTMEQVLPHPNPPSTPPSCPRAAISLQSTSTNVSVGEHLLQACSLHNDRCHPHHTALTAAALVTAEN